MSGPTSGLIWLFAALAVLLASCELEASPNYTDRTAAAAELAKARAEATDKPAVGLPVKDNIRTAALPPDVGPAERASPPRTYNAYKYKKSRAKKHRYTTTYYVAHRPRLFRPVIRLSFGRRF
jgi:hypothetical protein